MTSENRPSTIEQCILDIAECPICNEVLQDNRCLPCLHMFCLKCLELYRKGKPKGRPLPCPVCRKEFSFPKSIEGLPRNFFIDKLLDAHTIKAQDILPKICEICNEDTCKRRFTSDLIGLREDSNIALATCFCLDCRQYLCFSCGKQHKKIKATTWHKIIDSASVTGSQELAPRPTYCIQHKTKEAEVYCQDCKMVICWQCKALSHSSHASLDISIATKDLAAQLEEHIEEISKHLHTKQVHIQKLRECEKSYVDKINEESANISKEHRKLHRTITDNEDKLQKVLTTSTASHLDAFNELLEKLETEIDELNKHKVYIEQLVHLGNISDLSEYTNKAISKTTRLAEDYSYRIFVPPLAHLSEADLHDLLTGKRTDIDMQYCDRHMDNAEGSNDSKSFLQDNMSTTDDSKRNFNDWRRETRSEKLKITRITEGSKTSEWKCHSLNSTQIKDYRIEKQSSTVSRTTSGHLFKADDKKLYPFPSKQMKDEDSSKYQDWSLIKILTPENNRTVCGVTAMDLTLYVISQESNSISVYGATEFVFLKSFTVDGLVNPNDIVSCTFNDCLYICDWGIPRIFRVKVREEMEQINWPTGKDLGCLSVTTEHTVIMAGYVSNKLKEYTSDGELIRSIKLSVDFKPWHAIKLGCSSTHFVICQGDNHSSSHRVCLIGLDGEVKHVFGGVKGSDEEHLCGPYHLAIYKSGCILVNDCNNSRILLLSQDLKFIKEIIPSSSKVLRRVRRMQLDEVAGRLYVADNAQTDSATKDGRILVFSNSGGTPVLV